MKLKESQANIKKKIEILNEDNRMKGSLIYQLSERLKRCAEISIKSDANTTKESNLSSALLNT